MADADEDAIHHPPSHDSPAQLETDLSDETQDFRLLSFLTDNTQTSLPRRGEKDFEPNPTLYQADILAASRQAMHNALAYPRLHHPRNKVVGIYAPDGPRPPLSTMAVGKGSATPTTTTTTTTTTTVNDPATGLVNVSRDACVYVPNPKGQYFKSLGQADRLNRMWLLPEEALYLLERGSLEIWWPLSLTGCVRERQGGGVENEEGGNGEEEEMGIPMSLQAAYACFIGRGGLTTDRFSVFTGLKRLGYTIVRAPGWHDDITGKEDTADIPGAESVPSSAGLTGVFARLLRWMYIPDSRALPATGPLVGLGIHRSYPDIYRKLALIPWYDPVNVHRPSQEQQQHPATPYRIAFHVYKPSTAFRKSAPPDPDFRIAVINCRTETSVPTLAQLGTLLESTPLDPPRGEKMERLLYMRLRHGYRNVILGVVDQGVVSYLRVSDAAFGKEKLFEGKGAPVGNKGGRPFRPPKVKGG